MKVSLEGKVALVTGAGAGIGKAIVEAYKDIGATIVAAEVDKQRCSALAGLLGVSDLVVNTDVCEVAQVKRLRDQIAERFGKLDILVNNVGDMLGITGPFEESTEEEWEKLYNVNLKHMFIVTREMIPLIKRTGTGGSIINLSSIEGFRGFPYTPIYTTFKHAVTGFTRGLAVQLAGDQIRVNLIAPETTESDQVRLDKLLLPERRADAERTIPLGRFGRPEDHAGPAVFLASDLSAWMTGSSLVVDGGGLVAGGFQRTPSGEWTVFPMVSGKCTF